MAETPLSSDAYIILEKEDEHDSESPLTGYLFTDGDHQVLGWTQIGQDPEQFRWLLRSAAQFHGIAFIDDTTSED